MKLNVTELRDGITSLHGIHDLHLESESFPYILSHTKCVNDNGIVCHKITRKEVQ